MRRVISRPTYLPVAAAARLASHAKPRIRKNDPCDSVPTTLSRDRSLNDAAAVYQTRKDCKGISSAAVLNDFVALYNRAVPPSDVQRRMLIASQESREYLHIADPLLEDPQEVEQLEAVRSSVSNRYGVNLDDTDLQLLTEIMRQDGVFEAADAALQPTSGDVGTLNTDAANSEVSTGPSKIVTDDDVLGLAVRSDPDFAAAVEEIESARIEAHYTSADPLQSSPRLYLSFVQRGHFSAPSVPLAAAQAESSLPSHGNVATNSASHSPLPTDMVDPLGLSPLRFEFINSQMRTQSLLDGAVNSLAPETETELWEREPAQQLAVQQLPRLDRRPIYSFTSAPPGRARHTTYTCLFDGVRTARNAIPVDLLKAALASASTKSSSNSPSLCFSAGVTLVAVGATLALERQTLTHEDATLPKASLSRNSLTRTYIIQGSNAMELKRVANELYPQLLVSCLELQVEPENIVPQQKKKTRRPRSHRALQLPPTPSLSPSPTPAKRGQSKRKRIASPAEWA